MKKLKYILFILIVFMLSEARSENPEKKSAIGLVSDLWEKNRADSIKETLQMLKQDTVHYFFNEEDLDDLGYKLLSKGYIEEAFLVFETGVELFPENGNSYSSLADALLFSGDKSKALENYKLALEKGAWGSRRINYRISNIDIIFQPVQSALKSMKKQGPTTGLSGPYLGQPQPGNGPQLFAPGIISLIGWSFWCTFSPDGKEFYFSRGNKKKIIMFSKWEKNGWTYPVPASFTKDQFSNEPHITADNKRIYFGMGEGIFVSERTLTGWSDPMPAGPGMHVTSTNDGQVFVTDVSEISSGKMYLAKATMANGIIKKLDRLEGGIGNAQKSMQRIAHPCIAPDGSYMIFDNGRGMLHVSFLSEKGDWGEAIDLTKYGIDPNAASATVTPDGQYLFFDVFGDLYWMSTKLFIELKPKELK